MADALIQLFHRRCTGERVKVLNTIVHYERTNSCKKLLYWLVLGVHPNLCVWPAGVLVGAGRLLQAPKFLLKPGKRCRPEGACAGAGTVCPERSRTERTCHTAVCRIPPYGALSFRHQRDHPAAPESPCLPPHTPRTRSSVSREVERRSLAFLSLCCPTVEWVQVKKIHRLSGYAKCWQQQSCISSITTKSDSMNWIEKYARGFQSVAHTR